jgi:hypothetical protein
MAASGRDADDGRNNGAPDDVAGRGTMNFIVVLSLILAGFAVVGVFVDIPFVSNYAFWILVAAYVMVAGAWRGRWKHDD